MADNIAVTEGAGKTIAADEIAGALHQRVKITVGADGTNDGDVSTANPLPISDAGGTITVDGTVAVTNAGITSIDGKITACNTGAVVLAAGSAAVGKLAANSGVDIGDVDVTSIAAGDNNIGNVDIASAIPAGTNLIGKVGIDQLTANANEVVVKSGTVTTVTSITNAVAVTNAGITSIDGKITACNTGAVVVSSGAITETNSGDIKTAVEAINTKLASGTVIGDVNLGATDNAVLDDIAANQTDASQKTQVVDGSGNVIGATSNALDINIKSGNPTTIAVTGHNTAISGYGQAKLDHADVTTAQALVAAVADKKFYITSIILSVAAAGSYWIEDDDAAQITCKFTLAANGGVSWSCPIDTPFKSTTVNKGLKVKGSASGVIGCMITYYTLA